MPFPPTRAAMIEAGYSFHTNKVCPCGAAMELWNTPRGEHLPMEPMPDDDSKAESHFATCVKAVQFRRKPPAAATAHESRPGRTPPVSPAAPPEDMPLFSTKSASRSPTSEADGREKK